MIFSCETWGELVSGRSGPGEEQLHTPTHTHTHMQREVVAPLLVVVVSAAQFCCSANVQVFEGLHFRNNPHQPTFTGFNFISCPLAVTRLDSDFSIFVLSYFLSFAYSK